MSSYATDTDRGIYGLKNIGTPEEPKLVVEVDAIMGVASARIGDTIGIDGETYSVTYKGRKFRHDVRDHRLYLYVEECQ